MGLILTGKRLTSDVLREFYFRRVRRIVPVYMTVIAFVLAAAFAGLLPKDVARLLTEIRPALLFTSNFAALSEKQDYFVDVVSQCTVGNVINRFP